jgi:hypothetical protein
VYVKVNNDVDANPEVKAEAARWFKQMEDGDESALLMIYPVSPWVTLPYLALQVLTPEAAHCGRVHSWPRLALRLFKLPSGSPL